GGAKGVDRGIEPLRLALAPILTKRFETRTERAIAAGPAGPAVGSRNESFRSAHPLGLSEIGDQRKLWFTPRNRHPRRPGHRRRPVAAAPGAAGIAGYGARAARAPPARRARRGRARSSAAARRCRETRRPGGAARQRPWAAASKWWI